MPFNFEESGSPSQPLLCALKTVRWIQNRRWSDSAEKIFLGPCVMHGHTVVWHSGSVAIWVSWKQGWPCLGRFCLDDRVAYSTWRRVDFCPNSMVETLCSMETLFLWWGTILILPALLKAVNVPQNFREVQWDGLWPCWPRMTDWQHTALNPLL